MDAAIFAYRHDSSAPSRNVWYVAEIPLNLCWKSKPKKYFSHFSSNKYKKMVGIREQLFTLLMVPRVGY
jgi:hypothetical protein